MLEEQDIAQLCDRRTLRRARNICAEATNVYARNCVCDPGPQAHVRVRAEVRNESGAPCSVTLQLRQPDLHLLAHECTCLESERAGGLCKHEAAVTLAFSHEPESFRGYSAGGQAVSSPAVLELMRRTALELDGEELERENGKRRQAPGQPVDIDVVLVREQSGWCARFRVCTQRHRAVIHDVAQFVQDVRDGQTRNYGNVASVDLSLSNLTSRARQIVHFMERAVTLRSQLSRTLFVARVEHENRDTQIELTSEELVELLDLHIGTFVSLDDAREKGHIVHRARVLDADPRISMRLVGVQGGGHVFECPETLPEVIRSASGLYLCHDGSFYRCSPAYGPCAQLLAAAGAQREGALYLSEQDAAAFCADALNVLRAHMELSVPENLLALVPAACTIELFLDFDGRRCLCHALACYENHRFDLYADANDVPSDFTRDGRRERHAKTLLERYFTPPDTCHGPTNGVLTLQGDERVAALLFGGLAELRAFATLSCTPAFEALLCRKRPRIHIGLSLRAGLLELSLRSEEFESDELTAILSAYHERKRYARLSDGSYLELEATDLQGTEELLEALELDASSSMKGTFTLQPYRAFLLDELAAEASRDEAFTRYVRDIAEGKGPRAELPSALADVARPYQVEGFAWLCALSDAGMGGILADEMGLGKSLQLIAYLMHQREKERGVSLIVCPASLVYNWVAEFSKFAPGMRVLAIAAGSAERVSMLEQAMTARGDDAVDVVITSYDLLKRDIGQYERHEFECVTCDEAQYIKNPATQAARSVKRLRARHRFALTGTPIENRLSELWSIFDFLMPSFLGSYQQFHDAYEQPILAGDDTALEQLKRRTRLCILRRLKADVLCELPPKSESIVLVDMQSEQRRLYCAHEQSLREELRHDDATCSRNRMHVLAELTRLRELCCDPGLVYDDFDGASAKLDAIVELVGTVCASQTKALVFSQFTRYLTLIARRLDELGIAYYTITGSTPKQARVERAEAFNEDDTPVFLVSLKAGGNGLNLTGASVVIHADPWWNIAAENQATDRSHRIGQTKPVNVYKVLAKETIEQRVVALQEAKGELAERLVGPTDASMALTLQDMRALLGI